MQITSFQFDRLEDLQDKLINDSDRNYCQIGKEFCPDLTKRPMAYASEVIIIGLSVFHLAKELFQVTQVHITKPFLRVLKESISSVL